MTFALFLAQVPDMAKEIAALGWPGIFLWVVTTRLDRIEIAMKEFAMAIWMDIASRPSSEEAVREEARARIAAAKVGRKP